ncbi:MAG: hypothetical protein ACHP85_09810 [Burkholderiales bacterium]|jgi:hypothetical protein
MISTMLAIVAVLATQPQAAAKPTPVLVQVEASAKGGKAVEDWAKELRGALAARKDDFRLATDKEKAEFVVRLDSVGGASGAPQVLAGALVLGKATRPFTYSFTDIRVEAEKLARNLRPVADQMKATGK